MKEDNFDIVPHSPLKECGTIVSEVKDKKNKLIFRKKELKNTLLSKCIICSREKISEQDRLSFYKQDYLTVKTRGELLLYRVTSEKEGRDAEGKMHKGRFASPEKPFDRLSAKTDLALSYPFRNRMEVVEEIKVPMGEILQVGYVAPKTTGGKEVTLQNSEQGSVLQGMSMQVILPEGWQERAGWKILNRYPLESSSKYCEWETLIENRVEKYSGSKKIK